MSIVMNDSITTQDIEAFVDAHFRGNGDSQFLDDSQLLDAFISMRKSERSGDIPVESESIDSNRILEHLVTENTIYESPDSFVYQDKTVSSDSHKSTDSSILSAEDDKENINSPQLEIKYDADRLHRAREWRSALTADGKKYFYHRVTRESVWVLPMDIDEALVPHNFSKASDSSSMTQSNVSHKEDGHTSMSTSNILSGSTLGSDSMIDTAVDKLGAISVEAVADSLSVAAAELRNASVRNPDKRPSSEQKPSTSSRIPTSVDRYFRRVESNISSNLSASNVESKRYQDALDRIKHLANASSLADCVNNTDLKSKSPDILRSNLSPVAQRLLFPSSVDSVVDASAEKVVPNKASSLSDYNAPTEAEIVMEMEANVPPTEETLFGANVSAVLGLDEEEEPVTESPDFVAYEEKFETPSDNVPKDQNSFSHSIPNSLMSTPSRIPRIVRNSAIPASASASERSKQSSSVPPASQSAAPTSPVNHTPHRQYLSDVPAATEKTINDSLLWSSPRKRGKPVEFASRRDEIVSADGETMRREACTACGRMFLEERLEAHRRACQALRESQLAPRMPFSAVQQRTSSPAVSSLTYSSQRIPPCHCGRRFPVLEDLRLHLLVCKKPASTSSHTSTAHNNSLVLSQSHSRFHAPVSPSKISTSKSASRQQALSSHPHTTRTLGHSLVSGDRTLNTSDLDTTPANDSVAFQLNSPSKAAPPVAPTPAQSKLHHTAGPVIDATMSESSTSRIAPPLLPEQPTVATYKSSSAGASSGLKQGSLLAKMRLERAKILGRAAPNADLYSVHAKVSHVAPQHAEKSKSPAKQLAKPDAAHGLGASTLSSSGLATSGAFFISPTPIKKHAPAPMDSGLFSQSRFQSQTKPQTMLQKESFRESEPSYSTEQRPPLQRALDFSSTNSGLTQNVSSARARGSSPTVSLRANHNASSAVASTSVKSHLSHSVLKPVVTVQREFTVVPGSSPQPIPKKITSNAHTTVGATSLSSNLREQLISARNEDFDF